MEINRLTITTESRILGDEYVRFGGEYIETCFHKGKKGALCLAIGSVGSFINVLAKSMLILDFKRSVSLRSKLVRTLNCLFEIFFTIPSCFT